MRLLWIIVATLINRNHRTTTKENTFPTLPNKSVDQLMDIQCYMEMDFEARWTLATQLVNELVLPGMTDQQAEYVRDKISAAIIGLDYAP